jgi:hypothetical protein
MTQEEIKNQPKQFGKSTFVNNQFQASCEANESVEYRHPKYICMSLKRYNEIQSQTNKELIESMGFKIIDTLTNGNYINGVTAYEIAEKVKQSLSTESKEK